MSNRNFADRLCQAILRKGNPCVVGLDPRPELFPRKFQAKNASIKSIVKSVRKFDEQLIDLVADLVPAIKVQIAFYEQWGTKGLEAYCKAIQYAHQRNLLVIGDVKRGDIGSTAAAYAQAHLGSGKEFPDAITVNPLFGSDGIEPFVKRAQECDSGLFVLVRTSNPSAIEIQGLQISSGVSVSEHIAQLVDAWGKELRGTSGYSSIAAVVGATQAAAILPLRKKMPNTFILFPGYGAQGGSVAALAAAFDKNGLGALVTSSREILYAHQNAKYSGKGSWKEASLAALQTMIDDVQQGIQCA